MTFDIITIFPKIFDSYFSESIIRRAQEKGKIFINIHNLRNWTTNKHKTVDDKPYGGGAGMILKVEPIYKAVNEIKSKDVNIKTRVILFSAKGKKYTQADAKRLAKYEKIIMICGRYEGVDERINENISDEEISIGSFILTGGEIPAMSLVDSITRLIPGVLGNSRSTKDESFSKANYLEYPQYTKPEIFEGFKVPEILVGGDHKKIAEWKNKNSKKI